ncbi:MAG TPA: hypothetical protein VG722_10735 [Tepidisphaeraceae bacterium]|nr:hypothetical protein [Tepidisphaeraceae bacterium]
MPNKLIVRLELTNAAKDQLAAISKRTGMTQVSVSSRLFEWFAKQSEMLHGAVLGQYPKEMQADVAELILKRINGSKKR